MSFEQKASLRHDQSVETNHRPASPLNAGRQFGRARGAAPPILRGGR